MSHISCLLLESLHQQCRATIDNLSAVQPNHPLIDVLTKCHSTLPEVPDNIDLHKFVDASIEFHRWRRTGIFPPELAYDVLLFEELLCDFSALYPEVCDYARGRPMPPYAYYVVTSVTADDYSIATDLKSLLSTLDQCTTRDNS